MRQAVFELKLTETGQHDAGNIIRWVKKDIFEEEKETLLELGLTENETNGKISKCTASVFFDLLNAVEI